MSKYVRLDGGHCAGFFDDLVIAPPSDAIEIPDAIWAAWIVDVPGQIYDSATKTLAPYAPPPTAAQLAAYANVKQWALATGGYTITSTPVGGTATALRWATDATSFAMVTGKALRLQQPGAPASTRWQFASGYQTISTPDLLAAAIEIGDFIQATFDAGEPVLDAIAAGSITSYAQIDAAAWPSSLSMTPTP